MWLRGNLFHQRAIAIAFTVGAVAAQPTRAEVAAQAAAL